MANRQAEKSFDCVKWTREVRDRMYEETKHMSFDEWRSWLDERLATNPLAKNARIMTPPSTRWQDHGTHRVDGRDETQVLIEITHDGASGLYTANALRGRIHTQGASLDEIRANVKQAVDRYLDDTAPMARPKYICMRFLRDEVIPV